MEQLSVILAFLKSSGPDILSAILMVLGGLKVIARYTPFQWDDHVLAVVEKPVQWIISLIKR